MLKENHCFFCFSIGEHTNQHPNRGLPSTAKIHRSKSEKDSNILKPDKSLFPVLIISTLK